MKATAAVLGVLVLAACVPNEVPPPPDAKLVAAAGDRGFIYDCNDGTAIRATFGTDRVSLEREGVAVELPQVVAASGAHYATDSTSFWEKGGEATLEDKFGTTTCLVRK